MIGTILEFYVCETNYHQNVYRIHYNDNTNLDKSLKVDGSVRVIVYKSVPCSFNSSDQINSKFRQNANDELYEYWPDKRDNFYWYFADKRQIAVRALGTNEKHCEPSNFTIIKDLNIFRNKKKNN